MTTLKPCPNPECCSTDIGGLFDSYPYLVVCRRCDLSGPSGENKEEAIRLWNSLTRQPKWLPWDWDFSEQYEDGSLFFIRYERPKTVSHTPLKIDNVIEIGLIGKLYGDEFYWLSDEGPTINLERKKILVNPDGNSMLEIFGSLVEATPIHYAPCVMPKD